MEGGGDCGLKAAQTHILPLATLTLFRANTFQENETLPQKRNETAAALNFAELLSLPAAVFDVNPDKYN